MFLVGDIGGTNARLAIVSSTRGPAEPLVEAVYPSREYEDLEEVLLEFLSEQALPVERAVLAVAGPVLGGRAYLTNLGWEVDQEKIREALGGIPVRLINDLLALAHAVPHLTPASLRTLQVGRGEPEGAIAVLAPGTGLGAAFLLWDGWRYLAYPSEGGHADFAPTDRTQQELLEWLFRRKEGHVSYERVCSGLGVPLLYQFFRERGMPEEEWIREALREAEEPTAVIFEAALDPEHPSPLAGAVLDLFLDILAAEAGNMALRLLSTGGVYLGGGIVPRLLPLLEQPAFLTRFLSKGRMEGILESVPLHVILSPRAALLGAAHVALLEGGTAERLGFP